MLRDGAYLSEQDMFMKLEGVYVTSLGRLQAVVHPVHAIEQDLAEGDVTEHTADYRCFLNACTLTVHVANLDDSPAVVMLLHLVMHSHTTERRTHDASLCR